MRHRAFDVREFVCFNDTGEAEAEALDLGDLDNLLNSLSALADLRDASGKLTMTAGGFQQLIGGLQRQVDIICAEMEEIDPTNDILVGKQSAYSLLTGAALFTEHHR